MEDHIPVYCSAIDNIVSFVDCMPKSAVPVPSVEQPESGYTSAVSVIAVVEKHTGAVAEKQLYNFFNRVVCGRIMRFGAVVFFDNSYLEHIGSFFAVRSNGVKREIFGEGYEVLNTVSGFETVRTVILGEII